MTSAKRLIETIDKRKRKYNEYGVCRFQGVYRCTRDDIDAIRLYAETIKDYGQYSGRLEQPKGNVAAVLVNCGLYEQAS